MDYTVINVCPLIFYSFHTKFDQNDQNIVLTVILRLKTLFRPIALCKKEWNGGSVDWPQNFQTTNSAGPFWLSAMQAVIPINTIFILWSENSRNLDCYIRLVNNKNGKSTVPLIHSSFPLWIKCSVFVQIRAVCAWYQIKNHVHLSTRPIPWNYEEASQAIWAWWEKIKRSRISWTGRISRYLESIRLLTFMYLWPN